MHPADGRVISNFIIQALKNEPITIYGNGHQTRSFCFVDDLVEGLVLLMNLSPDLPEPVNLGNPVETTIKQVAEEIIFLTDYAPPLSIGRCPRMTRSSAAPILAAPASFSIGNRVSRSKLDWNVPLRISRVCSQEALKEQKLAGTPA